MITALIWVVLFGLLLWELNKDSILADGPKFFYQGMGVLSILFIALFPGILGALIYRLLIKNDCCDGFFAYFLFGTVITIFASFFSNELLSIGRTTVGFSFPAVFAFCLINFVGVLLGMWLGSLLLNKKIVFQVDDNELNRMLFIFFGVIIVLLLFASFLVTAHFKKNRKNKKTKPNI